MPTPSEQLDRRFSGLRPWISRAQRPPHGWLKAIRQALGMTTGQMAKRIHVAQTRVSEMEAAEAHGNITLKTLDKAAKALGCRVIYAVIPDKPLSETMKERAYQIAQRQLAGVEQTMLLEAQNVTDRKYRREALDKLAGALLHRPSRLWNDP